MSKINVSTRDSQPLSPASQVTSKSNSSSLDNYLEDFIVFLKSERNYSTHTVKSYSQDIRYFFTYCKKFNSPELSISRWGTIKISLKTMETNLSGVFAAGDIVRGASLVVWAIRDGRDVAVSIKKYLEQKLSKDEKAA